MEKGIDSCSKIKTTDSMKLKTCDSLFSTCCDSCIQRKQIIERGVRVPLAQRGERLENGTQYVTDELQAKVLTWDIWLGRTIELDICRPSGSNRQGLCRSMSTSLYLPYQKQRENWIYSLNVGDGRQSSRLPLYLRM